MENNSYTFNFKSALTTLIFFTAVLLLGGLALDRFMSVGDSNSNIGKSISENDQIYQPYDTLFIGDSRTHQGVIPRQFTEMKQLENQDNALAYNLGRPGMQSPFVYFIIDDYIRTTGHIPKQVFVNFSFYLLGGQQWMKDIYFAYYTPKAWQVLDAVGQQLLTPLEGFQWYFRTRIPLVRYKKRMSDLLLGFAEKKSHAFYKELSDIDQNRYRMLQPSQYGYLSRGTSSISDSDVKLNGYTKGIERGYSVYLYYMKKLFELASHLQFEIVVYDFPWPNKHMKDPLFQGIHDYYKKLIMDQAIENPYVRFPSHNFYWENKYFVDPLHLNAIGSEKLTDQILLWSSEK